MNKKQSKTCEMDLAVECKYCQKVTLIKGINAKDFQEWYNGVLLIQDAMPYISPADRELIMSKTCDDCWNKMFPNQEENDESKENTKPSI